MILVKIYWNTDENGDPVPEDLDLEDGPISFYGPFDSITDAVSWMENDYPDDDTEVNEMIADDFEVESHWYINEPQSIYGDIPDDDIRDDIEDFPTKIT